MILNKMKASELRIGNWVKIKEEFSERDIPLETLEFQIEGFNDGSKRYEEGAKQILFWSIKNKVFGTTTSGSYDIECEPIPITEEWLINFNFEKDGDDYIIEHPKDIVKYVLTENVLGKGLWILGVDQFYDKDYKYFSWGIKYVHQLQNLYFALTGEELILK
jgi:hypothetical protein